MKHIDFAKLIEKYEGFLSEIEEKEISSHLIACIQCNLSAKKLEAFFNYAKPSELEEVPHNLTANLLNIYRPKKTEAKKESFFNKLLANLVFDDWQMALNERLAFTDTRQMLYRVGNFDIDLRFFFIDGKCQVSGQIFPDINGQGVVKIISKNETKESILNKHSEFTFPLISEGIYDIQIHLDQTSIEIPKISLLH